MSDESRLLALESKVLMLEARIAAMERVRVAGQEQFGGQWWTLEIGTEEGVVAVACCASPVPKTLYLTNSVYGGTVTLVHDPADTVGGLAPAGSWKGCHVVTSVGGICAGGVSTAIHYQVYCAGSWACNTRWKSIGGGNDCPVTSTCGDTTNTGLTGAAASATCSPLSLTFNAFSPRLFGGTAVLTVTE